MSATTPTSALDRSLEGALERLRTRPWIDIQDYCAIYSRSRHKVYESIKRGEIETLNVDRTYRILTAPLRAELKIVGVLD